MKENEQIELSKNIALKVENYLEKPEAILRSVSNFISSRGGAADYSEILKLQINASESLQAIYMVGFDGRVVELVLKYPNPGLEKDLVSLDLSENPMVKEAINYRKPAWSNTFLSLVGGGLSVGFAVPSKEYIVVGEIDLGYLSDYLRQIADGRDQMILILDRRGQVIADRSGHFTAQQLNLNHISFIRKALISRGESVSGDFRLEGRMMNGYLVSTPLVDWQVLVAQTRKEALRPLWAGFTILGVLLAVTIGVGVLLAAVLSVRIAKKIEGLTRHSKLIAAGEDPGEWPVFSTFEFNSLARDIQAMADSMQEREAYSRILFADSPVPFLVVRPDTLECFDANQAALELFDAPSAEAIKGYSILNFSLPEQQGGENASAQMKQQMTMLSNQDVVNFEWMFFDKFKGIWYGDVSLSVFHHGKGDLIQMSIIDITKAKTEENRRKELEKKLIQARKMESIGTLAGGIAHDFNNILFPVLGFTEMALEDLPEDSPVRPSLTQVLKGCRTAKELVDQLLIFSRQDSRKYKPLQIQGIMEKVLEDQLKEIPEHIDVFQDISPEGGLVKADYDHIYLVVSNLITNAVSAMAEDGGRLSAASGDIQVLSGDLPGLNLIPGWYLCLRVSDTGPGIPPDILDSIFDPYFSTKGKSKDKGTGLGLAVVHGIVKSYQGEIVVDSKAGKGTVFNVYLPRYVSTGKSRDKKEVSGHPRETCRILLVDDEKTYLSMMEESLRRMGHTVTVFDNGINALNAFDSGKSEFDVVITDLLMPGMNGDLLARRVKEKFPDVPVILCTGFSDRIDQEDLSAGQIDEILIKPVLRDELAKVIIKVLNK